MDVTIIEATTSDTEAIVTLWADVFPEYSASSHPHRDPRANISRKLAFNDGMFWLASVNGEVVGSVMAGYDGHRGWIYSLGVHSAHRRHGIARKLLSHAEMALAARGCVKINMQVYNTNKRALQFYEACAYSNDHVVSLGKRLA